jgi:hypothetical protein
MQERARPQPADLQTPLESMLDQVWRSEADWRLWDRPCSLNRAGSGSSRLSGVSILRRVGFKAGRLNHLGLAKEARHGV